MSFYTMEEKAKAALAETSPDAAANKLLELIFENPPFFGYAKMDEDNRSAFLLSIRRVLPHMVHNYNPELSGFLSYLWTIVRMYAKSYLRGLAKQNAGQDSLTYCYGMENEAEVGRAEFGNPDTSVLPGDTVGHDGAIDRHEAEVSRCLEELSLPTQSRKKVVRDMMLVLALKNCRLISDRQLSLIIAITGLKSHLVLSYIQEARESLEPRMEVQQDILSRRNKAFYLKTKYRLELERLAPETPQFREVERKYHYQTRVLQSKNDTLRRRISIVPTNAVIGEILHLSTRRVGRLMELVRLGRLSKMLQKERFILEGNA